MKFFDEHLLNKESKDYFIAEIACIALLATQIPLSIYTNLFNQRFEKHSMLESMLEMLQQFYIQVETQSEELVINSNKMTYLSLAQGQALCDERNQHTKKDLITIYRNRHQKYNQLSLEQFFYQDFIQSTFNLKTKDNSNIANDDNHKQDVIVSNQHQILVPKGMNCTPRYPVDYAYAQGMLIMHKPWNK